MPRALPAATKTARLLEEATALHRSGRLEEAERVYRKVLKINPRDPDGLHLLGVLHDQRGDAQEGAGLIKRALAVRDDFPDAHLNVARILAQTIGDIEGAAFHVRRALHYRPTPAGYCDLGNLLRAQGKDAEALAAFRGSMECNPRSVEGYVYYARALRGFNEFAAMLSTAEAGLAIDPNNPALHIIISEACFGLGNLKEGWKAYRWRFKAPEYRQVTSPYQIPVWEGEDLTGRSVLVWGEQGAGDEIMYANMFGDLARRARRVVVQCSARLAPLFRRSFPELEVFDRNLTPDELHQIDFQSAAGSLGEWIRPTFESFPSAPSYLLANEPLRLSLRAKYSENAPNSILVGISWKSAAAEAAAEKSLNLLEWGPILQVPGLTFVNLQYGDTTLELQEASNGFGARIINDASIDPLRDLDSYAAQVAAMDIVVTSSNTAAHVAGALGVPTLCLLPRSLGRGRRWYWFAEHSSCPWYPNLRRLLRRPDGDWLEVIREAGLVLVDVAASRGVAVGPHVHAMARAFSKMGRTKDAESYYLRLSQEAGRQAEALTELGELRTAALDADGAFSFFDRALAVEPGYMPAYTAKAAVLNRLNRFDDAIAVYKAALKQDPASPVMRSNLGSSLLRLGRSEEALEQLSLAREKTGAAGAFVRDAVDVNYAAALKDIGRIDEALVVLDALIARSPEHVEAHYNRAQTRLAGGYFLEGWQEAEWRLKWQNANVRYDSFPHLKRWGGEPLAGKRVLIWTEQGIGDEVLIAGMIGDAIALAAHVTILCTPRLVKLFQRSFPSATVAVRQEPLPAGARDPQLDFQMSMGDLGRAFRPNFESFPKRRFYLTPNQSRVHELRRRYRQARPGALLVGISWSSHGNPQMGWLKSNNLDAWQPILRTPSIGFVNLQYGDRSAELARVRERTGVDVLVDADIDPMGDMDDFAAQIGALDLVISTSNTTVHVAGALGVPTWVLAPEGRGRHWYWFQNRDDSPWYPSLRFVRPQGGGGWENAIGRCADDLASYAQKESIVT